MHCWEIQEGDRLKPIEKLPLGLLYGYSVYTTFKVSTAPALFELHCERLKKDSEALGLILDPDELPSQDALQKTYRALRPEVPFPVVRLTIGADIQDYPELFKEKSLPAKLFLSFRHASLSSSHPLVPEKGLTLKSVQYQRTLPTLKHGAMTDIIALKRTARAQGYDDILLVNPQGHLCEASTANVFLILPATEPKGGLSVLTPRLHEDGCLPGVIRQVLVSNFQYNATFDVSRNTWQPLIRQEAIPASLICQGLGAFLTNAVQGIIPISAIDGHIFSWPQPVQELLLKMNTFLKPLLG